MFLVLMVSNITFAHTGEGVSGGFISGILHPVFGLDHVAAMVAVGIWGAFLGSPAIWILPVVFPLVMAFGGALGVLGVPIPAIEIGIASSSIVIGLFILSGIRPPLWVATIIVAAFAIFHGHAHGTELPNSANALAYSAGFVIATGILHLIGIGIGEITRWEIGKTLIRISGALIAAAGVSFLMASI